MSHPAFFSPSFVMSKEGDPVVGGGTRVTPLFWECVLSGVLASPWSTHTPPPSQDVSKSISFHHGFFEIKMVTNGYKPKTCHFPVIKTTFRLESNPTNITQLFSGF